MSVSPCFLPTPLTYLLRTEAHALALASRDPVADILLVHYQRTRLRLRRLRGGNGKKVKSMRKGGRPALIQIHTDIEGDYARGVHILKQLLTFHAPPPSRLSPFPTGSLSLSALDCDKCLRGWLEYCGAWVRKSGRGSRLSRGIVCMHLGGRERGKAEGGRQR